MLNLYCPICHSKQIYIFYIVHDVPVQSCLLLKKKSDAIVYPKGDINLGYCLDCSFITNLAYNPSLLDYQKTYEDQQCFSPTFNKFARDLAQNLVTKYKLYNKKILEIGCGKGDFLELLTNLGNNQGLGIDPAYIDRKTKNSNNTSYIRDYYSEKYSSIQADFVCCRHTLEHIYNPKNFLDLIRQSIGNRYNTTVFIEVPDTIRILDECAFWDIYYEHCSYFSPSSIKRLFRSCGFDIISFSRGFDNQYLLVEAKPSKKMASEPKLDLKQLLIKVKKFSKESHHKLKLWKDRLSDERKTKTVIWGSGSKCVSFMTTLKLKNEVNYIVDVNPYRQGKYLPGIGKKVKHPSFLKNYKPNSVIIMNPIYEEEIQMMLLEMGINTQVFSIK